MTSIAPRVRIDLAYVGTAFHGWQIQPGGLRTVQGELAAALERLLQRPCLPVGAGRTDAGVHALGQVAHAELKDAREVSRVTGALARLVPDDMQVHAVREVSPAFNARLSAIWRCYHYHLRWTRNLFDPHALVVAQALDREAMDDACDRLLGTHDFASFCKTSSLKVDNTCRVDLCELEWAADGCIFRVRADRFLHHMVRNLVGLLVEVGRGARQPHDVASIIAARQRAVLGMMAPAQGLFLAEVGYPERLLDPGYVPDDFIPRPPVAGDPSAEGD